MALVSLIVLKSITVALGRRIVLNGVDLTLEAGCLTVIVGPNGAGKTTLLKTCLGLVRPAAGEVRLGEDPIRSLSPRLRAERVAYLPQDRRVAWNMPAVEVAALGAPWLSGRDAISRARQALDLFGVGHLADRGVGEMSGGERARVLLARAFAAPARMLLADEPAADLDPDAQLMVMERLVDRARQGRAVCASLHDLGLAARFADRIVVLDQGRIAADGPPGDALSSHVLKTVFGLEGVWLDAHDGPALVVRRA